MVTTTYNGWRNRETWNVALWIGNDEGLYHLAKTCKSYKEFVDKVGSSQTPDGVSWNDSGLDLDALDEMIAEL